MGCGGVWSTLLWGELEYERAKTSCLAHAQVGFGTRLYSPGGPQMGGPQMVGGPQMGGPQMGMGGQEWGSPPLAESGAEMVGTRLCQGRTSNKNDVVLVAGPHDDRRKRRSWSSR